MCEMSRQASNTESTGNPADPLASFLVLDELIKVSNEELASETMSEKSEDTVGRSNSNSDSSIERASSEGDNSDSTVSVVDKNVTISGCSICGFPQSRDVPVDDEDNDDGIVSDENAFDDNHIADSSTMCTCKSKQKLTLAQIGRQVDNLHQISSDVVNDHEETTHL